MRLEVIKHYLVTHCILVQYYDKNRKLAKESFYICANFRSRDGNQVLIFKSISNFQVLLSTERTRTNDYYTYRNSSSKLQKWHLQKMCEKIARCFPIV